jgi:hypothetical protein
VNVRRELLMLATASESRIEIRNLLELAAANFEHGITKPNSDEYLVLGREAGQAVLGRCGQGAGVKIAVTCGERMVLLPPLVLWQTREYVAISPAARSNTQVADKCA